MGSIYQATGSTFTERSGTVDTDHLPGWEVDSRIFTWYLWRRANVSRGEPPTAVQRPQMVHRTFDSVKCVRWDWTTAPAFKMSDKVAPVFFIPDISIRI